MSDEQPRKDPEIFKHLSPKTQGYLRQANNQRLQAEASTADMSNEQT
jgi:nucleoside-diphosphate kinase